MIKMKLNTSYDDNGNMIVEPELENNEKETLSQMDIHELESWICEEFFPDNGLRYMDEDEKILLGDITDKDIITTLDCVYTDDELNEESWIYNYCSLWYVDLIKGETIKFTKRGNL